MGDGIIEHPSEDALAVLAACEAAGDERAAATVRAIIEDFSLTAAVKDAFFADLRQAFDGPSIRGKRPYAIMVDFVNGPGRQYMMQGEAVPGLTVNTDDPQQYVQTLMALAVRDHVSRVLITPAGSALYRGSEMHLLAPSPGVLYPLVFEYCRGMVGLAERENEIACTVAPDGTLQPGDAQGVHGRMQVVTDGRVFAIQVLLQRP